MFFSFFLNIRDWLSSYLFPWKIHLLLRNEWTACCPGEASCVVPTIEETWHSVLRSSSYCLNTGDGESPEGFRNRFQIHFTSFSRVRKYIHSYECRCQRIAFKCVIFIIIWLETQYSAISNPDTYLCIRCTFTPVIYIFNVFSYLTLLVTYFSEK